MFPLTRTTTREKLQYFYIDKKKGYELNFKGKKDGGGIRIRLSGFYFLFDGDKESKKNERSGRRNMGKRSTKTKRVKL